MAELINWFTEHESALSGIAALIAIIAGIAVTVRFSWSRMPGKAMGNLKRPAFLSDWRNIALISVTTLALLLIGIVALSPDSEDTEDPTGDLDVSGKPSVAVLPLNNMSGDPEQAYLADGIAEDVITLLSRNPRFFVIARNSSFTYRGQAVDIRQVGEELGVRYVVEGSLRKVGERLRITVQLIESASGRHVWAEQYDRPLKEMYDLQDEITNGIAVALGDQIFTAEVARANSIPTANLDAWGLVMRASQALTVWNSESSHRAETLFRQALQQDPDYAVAQAELARTLCWRAINQWSQDPQQDFAEGYQLGERALQTAPNDPLVLYGVGACYGVKATHTERGIRLLKKAVKLQPSFAMAHGMLGIAYTFNSEPERGLSPGAKALQLAPRSPYTWLYASWQAGGLTELDRHGEAQAVLMTAIDNYDGWWFTWYLLAKALAGQNDIDGARQALYTAREKETSFSLASLKSAADFGFKDKGEKGLYLLEPIWPEDLLTADEPANQ